MNVDVLSADQLSAEHIAAWSAMQRGQMPWDNPLYCPEFALAVSAVRDDVEIAVFQQGDRPVGFLPFQRDRNNVGRPIAARISELQGAVIDSSGIDSAGQNFAEQFLSGAELSSWKFDCVPAVQQALSPYHCGQHDFPFIDISEGFDAYRQQRRQAGSSLV